MALLPNIQTFARLAQLGNNPQLQIPKLSTEVVPFRGFNPPSSDEMDIDAEIAKIYQPRTTMQDLTNQMLQNYPQRDTSPSIWRRIGAVLSGMGSENPMATSDQFLNYHYYRNLGDWQNQFKGASIAADDERLANAQLRQLAEQTVSRKLTQQRQEETERKNLATEKDKERMRANQEEKTRLAWFKQQNPQLKLVTSIKGGNIHVFNPATGQLQDTGIDSGTLSDVERIGMQLESSLEQIRERGAESRKTQSEGITQRGEETKKQIEQREQNIRTRPPTVRTGAGGSAELEKTRAMNNRAREAALQPEWSRWIKFEPGGRFTVTPPKTGYFGSGPDETTFKAINAYIRGDVGSSTRPSANVPQTGTGRSNTPTSGTVLMTDGKRLYNIPANMVAKAKADKLKEVK